MMTYILVTIWFLFVIHAVNNLIDLKVDRKIAEMKEGGKSEDINNTNGRG